MCDDIVSSPDLISCVLARATESAQRMFQNSIVRNLSSYAIELELLVQTCSNERGTHIKGHYFGTCPVWEGHMEASFGMLSAAAASMLSLAQINTLLQINIIFLTQVLHAVYSSTH